jgi:hypothetical protein
MPTAKVGPIALHYFPFSLKQYLRQFKTQIKTIVFCTCQLKMLTPRNKIIPQPQCFI